uniref:Choline kinase N-terminal domain-containing protein n=1 Tax=Globisporangium ultimum (strain ATCC 200006 / CBS 805.95 / DAOM BR144) TaxID=431595 RepID=K3WNK0_GLOUD
MAFSTESKVIAGPFLAAAGALEKEKQKLHASLVKTLAECTPGWKDVKPDDIDVKHLSGAMTNLILSVSKPSGENADLLIRIYGEGTDSFFVRSEETRLFQLLSSKNIGIELLGQFSNGRVERLIDGTTLTSKQMRQPEVLKAIARKMRVFHHIDIDIDHTPRYMSEIHRLLEIARKKCTGPRFDGIVDFDEFVKDVKELEHILDQVPSPVVLSHNDLQYGNIMKTDNDVVLIDFEYTSYNPRGYDLGNHFCEWAYDYHKTINPHLGDFSKYPTAEQQREFCRAYLSGEHGDVAYTEEDVEVLRKEANSYSLASHLFWGLWGFIQAVQSEIDFDFLAYAKCRYDAFKSRVTIKN